MNVFLITLQRIDRISYVSPKASEAPNYQDKLSIIFLIMEVFRQFAVHIHGKMSEAAGVLYHQAYFPTCKHVTLNLYKRNVFQISF